MSKIIIVEATLNITALNPCMEDCWWQLKVHTAKSLYDSRGQRFQPITRATTIIFVMTRDALWINSTRRERTTLAGAQ